jgi:hypothetical protein
MVTLNIFVTSFFTAYQEFKACADHFACLTVDALKTMVTLDWKRIRSTSNKRHKEVPIVTLSVFAALVFDDIQEFEKGFCCLPAPASSLLR